MTHASFPFRCSSFFFATRNSKHPEVAWDIVGVLRNFGTQPGALSDEGISNSEQDLETVGNFRGTPTAKQSVDFNVIQQKHLFSLLSDPVCANSPDKNGLVRVVIYHPQHTY